MATRDAATAALTDLLLDEPGVGRCVVAPDGRVLRANAEWLRSVGLDLDDVLGASLADLLPETWDAAAGLRAQARRRVEARRRTRRLGSHEAWWKETIDPVPMEGGTGVLLTTRRLARDAGAQAIAAARREHDVTSAVLDTIANVVVVLDPEGRVVECNEACLRATGYALAEITGRSVFELLVPEEDLPGVRAQFEQLRAGRFPHRHRNRWRMKDGAERLLDWVNTCVVDARGDVVWIVGTATDVTQQVRSEQALHDSELRFREAQDALRDREARLRETHERFAAAIQSSPVVVFTQDLDLRYTWIANPALGYRADEVIGKTDLDLYERREDAERLAALKRGVLETGVPARAEVPVHDEGVVRWYDVSVQPQRADDGEVVGILATATDVTERKRVTEALRESEERFRTLADHIAQLAWIADEKGSIFWYNRRWLEYTGSTLDEMRGWGWRRVHHPDHVDRVVEKIAHCFATGESWEDTFPLRGRDGRYRWFLSRALPIRDAAGNVVRWFGTNTDVTEQREATEALRDADRRKSEFIAMLSHELRNPLAPLRNGIYVLERAAAGSEQAVRAREVVRRQTEHLAHLVDDLLDVTRISRGKIGLERTRVDLREIARRTTDDLMPVFTQKGVELRMEGEAGAVWIDADPTRIAQVLGNLLHNALKFTPAGGVVSVAAAAAGGAAELRVRDTGVGMDPATVERMFEPFAQADQTLARTQGGLGLGLALVKGLVDLHGGTVEARTEGIGRGAEILVRLPFAGASAASRAGSGRAAGVESRSILLVEDNVDAGRTLADVLELHGHRVRLARDGRSGLALARQLRPDVVLCDIGLPDLDGYAFARELRREDPLRATRLVALSGYAQPEDQRLAREAGFDAHLAKPPDVDALLSVVEGAT